MPRQRGNVDATHEHQCMHKFKPVNALASSPNAAQIGLLSGALSPLTFALVAIHVGRGGAFRKALRGFVRDLQTRLLAAVGGNSEGRVDLHTDSPSSLYTHRSVARSSPPPNSLKPKSKRSCPSRSQSPTTHRPHKRQRPEIGNKDAEGLSLWGVPGHNSDSAARRQSNVDARPATQPHTSRNSIVSDFWLHHDLGRLNLGGVRGLGCWHFRLCHRSYNFNLSTSGSLSSN